MRIAVGEASTPTASRPRVAAISTCRTDEAPAYVMYTAGSTGRPIWGALVNGGWWMRGLAGRVRELAAAHEHAPLVAARRASGGPAQLPLFTAVFNYRHSPRRGDRRPVPGIAMVDARDTINYPLKRRGRPARRRACRSARGRWRTTCGGRGMTTRSRRAARARRGTGRWRLT